MIPGIKSEYEIGIIICGITDSQHQSSSVELEMNITGSSAETIVHHNRTIAQSQSGWFHPCFVGNIISGRITGSNGHMIIRAIKIQGSTCLCI